MCDPTDRYDALAEKADRDYKQMRETGEWYQYQEWRSRQREGMPTTISEFRRQQLEDEALGGGYDTAAGSRELADRFKDAA